MRGAPTTFWGKLERDDDTNTVRAWHPLLAHCADVAACTEALLQRTILGSRLAEIGKLADRLDDVAIARLSVIAALHDIGKFNLGFQRKGDPDPQDTAGHVGEVLSLFRSDREEWALLVKALPAEELASWADSDAAFKLLVASIGHHGKPVSCRDGIVRPDLWKATSNLAPFAGIARLTASAKDWFPAAFESTTLKLPDNPEFQHAFAGIVMLADWLGSDREEGMFPFTDTTEDRMPFARDRAARSLQLMGLDARLSRAALGPGLPEFDSISEFVPRDAQVRTLGLPIVAQGSLTILESETGSGKTEAALVRFLRMFHAGVVDGMTFALPTRTAATQIHSRILAAIERAFPDQSSRPPVVLAVPGYLQVDHMAGRRLPEFEVLWNDDLKERTRYRGWAAEHPKRYLAGAIVVGTIDQVLLSSLRVGHSHMRASALLRHLLVVDEVHASDTYMTRILREVLRFHLAAGGHAFLMSATLGTAVREELQAAATGSSPNPMALGEALNTPYPTLHHSQGVGQPLVVAIEAPGLPKVLCATVCALADDVDALVTEALRQARRGARVLILRNTVTGAVATQLALENTLEAGDQNLVFRVNGIPTLHHARFSKEDREQLDRQIEVSLGKGARQDVGFICVATQTVQQSLDLDADMMFTDLAPMDVLLQRFGRVHRHRERDQFRPEGFQLPQVVVMTGVEPIEQHIRANGETQGPHGIGTVYQDLLVLEATRRELARRAQLRIPEQNRELVELTTHPDALSALRDELSGVWQKHYQVVRGQDFAHRGLAGLNLVERDQHFGDYSFRRSELDERIASRLGESDRRAPFKKVRGPFGIEFSQLNIPGWLARGVPPDPDLCPTDIVKSSGTQGGEIRFRFGELAFIYDRLGLRASGVSPRTDDFSDA